MIDYQENDSPDQRWNESDRPQDAVGARGIPAQCPSDKIRYERTGDADESGNQATPWFPAWNDKLGQRPDDQADDESSN